MTKPFYHHPKFTAQSSPSEPIWDYPCFGGAVPMMIDVLFDKLEYCHPIHYKDRLDKDPLRVSLADILLQKLQIREINDKDLKDIEYLFATADVGDDDDRNINCSLERHPTPENHGPP